MTQTVPVTCVAYAENLLTAAAGAILEHHAGELPDLTGCTLLIPDPQAAPALRRALLEAARARGHEALLGPEIKTPAHWLQTTIPLPRPVLAPAAQELVMVEAVRDARHLFNAGDPWLLAGELLTLFSELTLANAAPTDFAEFEHRLARAYGIGDATPTPFGVEARMVHTLWRAWHDQLDAQEQLDAAQAHVLRLAQSLAATGDDRRLWLIGFTDPVPAEIDWLRHLLDEGRAHLFLQGTVQAGDNGPGTPLRRLTERLAIEVGGDGAATTAVSGFLDTVFDDTAGTLVQRAAWFADRHPRDPVAGTIATLATETAEQEAHAVALQVRRLLLDGHYPVGVVTEDRRLARRIRALLERAQLSLQDAGGWALSTTSAAAALERWLETVEEDFAQASLLDALKSPFTLLFDDRDHHLRIVRHLEQDIIVHENIARGLHRYRKHAGSRAARLSAWNSETRRDIDVLLNRLDHAAEPLRELLEGRHPAAAFVPALRASLDALGMTGAFADDPAGQRILQELATLENAGRQHAVALHWREFRGWLGGTLERFTFRPETGASPVQLTTFEQSTLQRFEALIIAGCSAAQLPGTGGGHAFFNEAVRAELGLTTWRERLLGKLYHFRRALESAPRVLLTWHRDNDGEPVQPAPWLELIETFHEIAYGGTLADDDLAALLRLPDTEPVADTAALPDPVKPHPAPVLPEALLPDRWSPASYQRMVDCPYRFFAADGLRLKAREDIREKLEKSDFGEYVHRVLHAFHCGDEQLPGPFANPLSEDNRPEAERLLKTISQAVFAQAVDENFEARSWLKQWLASIPAYLDWQRERERDWRVAATEQRLEHTWPDGMRMTGRADRIDTRGNELAVLDYKTGATPRLADVEAGEAVQLPSYALLQDGHVTNTLYVRIDNGDIDSRVALEGEPLDTLVQANEQRLRALTAALKQGAGLSAWGDHKVCGYCDFDGLCRRQVWDDDADE